MIFRPAWILGIDLGTTTGTALLAADGSIVSQTVRLPRANPTAAYLALAGAIDCEIERQVKRLGHGGMVAYEDVPAQAHTAGDAAHRWGGFEAILMMACGRADVPFLGVPPATWKRAAGLGSGTGPAAALLAARGRWADAGIASPDEAVARWIAVAARRMVDERKIRRAR